MMDPVEVLKWAASKGETRVCELCVLKYGVDASEGLPHAVDHKDTFKWLMIKGGGVPQPETVEQIISKGDGDLLKCVIESGTQIRLNELMRALEDPNSCLESGKVILDHFPGLGIDNNYEAFVYVIERSLPINNYYRLAFEFLRRVPVASGARGQFPLKQSILVIGDLPLCKELVNRGADVHYNSNEPLLWSQDSGRTEIITWISDLYVSHFKERKIKS